MIILVPKISSKPKPVDRGANDRKVEGRYPIYPRAYQLTRTVGGVCRGFIHVSEDVIYRVTPTDDGFTLERLAFAGAANEQVVQTVRYHVDPQLNVSAQ